MADPVYINGYPMDLAISETHGFESEVTEHPVERGADMVDHVRARPIEIRLECIVSDTPIGAIATDPTRLPEGQDAPLPSEDAYARLLAIRDARQPVPVETSLGTFTSMALLSLSVPRSRETTGGLFFTVAFRQIVVRENQRVTVRTAEPNAKRSGRHGYRSGKRPLPLTIWWNPRWPPGTGELIGEPPRVAITVEVRNGVMFYGSDVANGMMDRKRGQKLDATDREWLAKDRARETRDRLSKINTDVFVETLLNPDSSTGNAALPPEVYEASKPRSGVPVF